MGSLVDRSLDQAAFAALPALLTIALLLRLGPAARPAGARRGGGAVARPRRRAGCGCRSSASPPSGVGACVAICGAIGFIGLVAPIFARRLTARPSRPGDPARGLDRRAAAPRRRPRRPARAARADAADRRGHRLARRALLPLAGRPYALAAALMTLLERRRPFAARAAVRRRRSRSGAGELVCLVGPNGSGKTSLLHALAGIGGPAGKVSDRRHRSARRSAPASAGRTSHLSCRRRATCPGRCCARDLIALGGGEAADFAGAGAGAACSTGGSTRLSTGERSRVLIARALAPRPKLLLLDEPTANLDPLWQIRLMELVRDELRRGGRAALVAIHDLDAAAPLCRPDARHGRRRGSPPRALARCSRPMSRRSSGSSGGTAAGAPVSPPADPAIIAVKSAWAATLSPTRPCRRTCRRWRASGRTRPRAAAARRARPGWRNFAPSIAMK